MFGTLSFEGVSPGIRRVTPDDMPRGTVSRGGDDRGRLPQLAPLRGDNIGIGCLSVEAQVKCRHYFGSSCVPVIDPVLHPLFQYRYINMSLQQDTIVVIPPLCIKCIMTKSSGRELSCAFDAILQFVEIKSVEKA